MPVPRLDLTGHRFGRLTAKTPSFRNGKTTWVCRCDCGGELETETNTLQRGRAHSCGCLFRERLIDRSTKHGGRHTRGYEVWMSMRARCTNPKARSWPDYGGRGITVCDRWLDFETFLADMGQPPDGMSIDRIDNSKGYSPENCRWATPAQQARNQRGTKLSEGKVREIRRRSENCGAKTADLAEIYGVSPTTISNIVRGKTWKLGTGASDAG